MELCAVSHMQIHQASCPEHKPHLHLLPQSLSFSLQPAHKRSALRVFSPCCLRPGVTDLEILAWEIPGTSCHDVLYVPGSMVSRLQPDSSQLLVTWPRQRCITLWGSNANLPAYRTHVCGPQTPRVRSMKRKCKLTS